MQEIFGGYTGEHKDILYIIGCILLSGFTGATEAAQLQLAVLLKLDTNTKTMKGMYRFFLIPYFEAFWKQKLIAYPQEFTGKDHLRSKGFDLIAKTNWQEKIRVIFRVFCNHLNVQLTTDQQDFIDN